VVGSSTGGVHHTVTLMTRDGCSLCARAAGLLADLAGELVFDLEVVDVDRAAAAGDPALRAEYGDRLPVVLLDGAEHSYWEVDEPGLRADLAGQA
jgi:glutaredoxin